MNRKRAKYVSKIYKLFKIKIIKIFIHPSHEIFIFD